MGIIKSITRLFHRKPPAPLTRVKARKAYIKALRDGDYDGAMAASAALKDAVRREIGTQNGENSNAVDSKD